MSCVLQEHEYRGCICLDTKRKLIAYTSSTSIVVLKPSGKVKDVIKDSHDKNHQFKQLSGIDYCPSADLYVVTDIKRHCVMLVKPKTRKVFKSFGEFGNKPDQLNVPKYIKCTSHNDIVTLVVCDTGNNCVKTFNTEGQLLQTWGLSIQLEGRLSDPRGICIGDNDEIYVADAGNRRVVKFFTVAGVDYYQTVLSTGELDNTVPHMVSFLPGSEYSKIAVTTVPEDIHSDEEHDKLLIFKLTNPVLV